MRGPFESAARAVGYSLFPTVAHCLIGLASSAPSSIHGVGVERFRGIDELNYGRHSSPSYFAAKHCGRPSRVDTPICVRLFAFRILARSFVAELSEATWAWKTGSVTAALALPDFGLSQIGMYLRRGLNGRSYWDRLVLRRSRDA